MLQLLSDIEISEFNIDSNSIDSMYVFKLKINSVM